MTQNVQNEKEYKQLESILKDVRTAMLSTIDEDGQCIARPMSLQQAEFDGDLWFFTSKGSRKVDHIKQHSLVGVTFSNDKQSSWISITGNAEIVSDNEKITELWNPLLKAWFPEGAGSPDLVLLKVNASGAEYWDSPSSRVVTLFRVVKSAVTGESTHLGDNERIKL